MSEAANMSNEGSDMKMVTAGESADSRH